MKNAIALVIVCLFAINRAGAQSIAPPRGVQTTFQDQHPDVERPFWEIREGAHVALFKEEGQLVRAFFEGNGEWRETRKRTPLTLLPEAVQYFVRHHFEHTNITYVGVVTSPVEKPLYRVESELHNAVVIKLLDEEGVLVRQERIAFDTVQQVPVTSKD